MLTQHCKVIKFYTLSAEIYSDIYVILCRKILPSSFVSGRKAKLKKSKVAKALMYE